MDEYAAYQKVRVGALSGRYVPYRSVVDFLEGRTQPFTLGTSVLRQPLYGLRMGRGTTRVLLWSQMHGNETTTTRAVLDLIQWLQSDRRETQHILESLELWMVPVLNPDGADAYTRVNANQIDLNRDAMALSQPESRALRNVFEACRPDFCFNLHDQRTRYGVGDAPVPATLSFLAPSAEATRAYVGTRIDAARLIGRMAAQLGGSIGIGRYDDAYNPACVGDHFQAAGVPTLLFEAGHYPGDYQREVTRYHVFRALAYALQALCDGSYREVSLDLYEGIPENRATFADILISNAHLLGLGHPEGQPLGLQFREVLEAGHIRFRPEPIPSEEFVPRYGHRHWDASRPGDVKALRAQADICRILGDF